MLRCCINSSTTATAFNESLDLTFSKDGKAKVAYFVEGLRQVKEEMLSLEEHGARKYHEKPYGLNFSLMTRCRMS